MFPYSDLHPGSLILGSNDTKQELRVFDDLTLEVCYDPLRGGIPVRRGQHCSLPPLHALQPLLLLRRSTSTICTNLPLLAFLYSARETISISKTALPNIGLRACGFVIQTHGGGITLGAGLGTITAY